MFEKKVPPCRRTFGRDGLFDRRIGYEKCQKSTLISAVLAIVMCVSLLAGSTFALFTSESKVNLAVTSGNVEVVASIENIEKSYVDENGETVSGKLFGGDATFADGTLSLDNIVPKDTVKFHVKIANNSSVAIKYRTVVTVVEDNGLASSLSIDLAGYQMIGTKAASAYAKLDAGEQPEVLPVTITLPESETTQRKSCKLSVSVEAVQGNAAVADGLTSTDGTTMSTRLADGTVWYDVLANGSAFTVKTDMNPANTIISNGKLTIDAKDKEIANTVDLWQAADDNEWSLVSARGTDGEVTVKSGSFLAKENDCYAVDVQGGATVVIEGGTFAGNIHAVYVYEGKAIIKGGFFSVQQPYPKTGLEYEFVINCYDGNRENGTASVEIMGGTYVNFNPADNTAEGAHTNFVADGYTVVSETQANGDVWYTVVPVTND